MFALNQRKKVSGNFSLSKSAAVLEDFPALVQKECGDAGTERLRAVPLSPRDLNSSDADQPTNELAGYFLSPSRVRRTTRRYQSSSLGNRRRGEADVIQIYHGIARGEFQLSGVTGELADIAFIKVIAFIGT